MEVHKRSVAHVCSCADVRLLKLQPQRSFSVDHTHKIAEGELEVSAEEIAAAEGHVATARKRKQLASVSDSDCFDFVYTCCLYDYVCRFSLRLLF